MSYVGVMLLHRSIEKVLLLLSLLLLSNWGVVESLVRNVVLSRYY